MTTKTVKLNPDARVRIVSKENPRREGTGRYQDYETIRKMAGKTVTEVLRRVPRAALRSAVRRGFAAQVTRGRPRHAA